MAHHKMKFLLLKLLLLGSDVQIALETMVPETESEAIEVDQLEPIYYARWVRWDSSIEVSKSQTKRPRSMVVE